MGAGLGQLAGGDAVEIYRRLTNLRPNAAQRAQIAAAVTDLVAWQGSLEHWLAHHWNPRNIPGQLDLYQRGGASACRYCRLPGESGAAATAAPDQPPSGKNRPGARSQPAADAYDAIQNLRQRYRRMNSTETEDELDDR